jgi:HEPN domain-containing protein
LKAIIVRRTGLHPFTHDLTVLLSEIEEFGLKVPAEIRDQIVKMLENALVVYDG